jgi:FdhE protein
MIVRPPAAESRWAARAARARELAASRPEARDALEFLARLTTLQHELATQYRDIDAALPHFMTWLATHAPLPIAQAARTMTSLPANPAADTAEAFILEGLLQVFPPDPCSHCKTPVVSVLREAAHGSRRWHVCGACLTESAASRLGCAACGEQRVEALPIFRSDATDPARIDACETCRVYVKTIDLTRDGSACAIADDVASVTLDLWARDRGYHRQRPNLLRL